MPNPRALDRAIKLDPIFLSHCSLSTAISPLNEACSHFFLKNSKFWGHTPFPKKHSYSCWSDLGFGFQQLLEENLGPIAQLEPIALRLAAKLDSIAFGIQNRKDNAVKCYNVVHSTNILYLQWSTVQWIFIHSICIVFFPRVLKYNII